jgi:hypothetical protein
MAIFKMYDCDFGVTIRGVNYQFDHVESFEIEDNERTRIIRGANAGNKYGLEYKEGIKEAKVITLTVIGMPSTLHDLLKDVYEKRERVDCWGISRVDGSSKIAKNAILSQSPKQLSLSDSPDSMNTALMFESFDVEEVHKS